MLQRRIQNALSKLASVCFPSPPNGIYKPAVPSTTTQPNVTSSCLLYKWGHAILNIYKTLRKHLELSW
jgi:hypothetical protein